MYIDASEPASTPLCVGVSNAHYIRAAALPAGTFDTPSYGA